MAKRKKKGSGRRKKPPVKAGWSISSGIKPETLRGLVIVSVFGASAVFALSLLDVAGPLGTYVSNGLRWVFGWFAWVFTFLLFGVGVQLIRIEKTEGKSIRPAAVLGLLVFVSSLSGILHLTQPHDQALEVVSQHRGGGFVGFLASYYLEAVASQWLTFVILFVLAVGSLLVMLSTSLAQAVDLLQRAWEAMGRALLWVRGRTRGDGEKGSSGIRVSSMQVNQHGSDDDDEEDDESEEERDPRRAGFETRPVQAASVSGEVAAEDGVAQTERLDPNWKPFPLKLLVKDSGRPETTDLEGSANKIRDTLDSFGIQVDMEEVNVGPTVTQFTMRPAEGVRLNQITTLQSDLSLALAAHPLRIEAPIPGRSLVGIEVPNKTVSTVRLRGVLESQEFKDRKSALSLPLGRTVSGASEIANLAKMPHLLIAGATGAGKSVCINSILVSLLYQNSPQELKLILVDPKKVELTNYNGLPHLLTPVVTEVDKTVNALKWAVSEMERRFKLLSEVGKRDITSYNEISDEKLPYLVIVIDELADLMAVAANEVEAAIVRLAQMARAVGIHLILATQRPSVNVITGLIKANITARIAFAVASQIDSRTIIDTAGAEKLLGNGDMLYITSDLSKPRRVQGAFVDDKEIKRVKEASEDYGVVDYNEDVTDGTSGSGGSSGGDGGAIDDDLYDEARALVIQTGKASASYLQRRLRVGYARAARLLDILEEQGVVGPADGARPREVFVQPDDVPPPEAE
ncbi:MAG: DNA translocase FtsK 4TM domain-containing protein [Candidatus Doudnabacteria bacterium]|nr:DNA translocase FtsK 4TM domain-containing protein [Candidatus Doudnabacteria bacterium]MCA9387502.1 DNA translocase FtsK 4TM domain-containing protein [Candidatus Andersenbacteria bacterium]